MGKFTTSLFVLTLACAVATEAEAQTSYYARSKLHGVSTQAAVTPPPTTPPVQGEWTTGSWSAWSSTCSPSAKRTRTVTCMADGSPSTSCDAETKPDESETDGVYTGCTEMVVNGGFSAGFSSWSWRSAGITTTSGNTGNVVVMNANSGSVSQTTYPLVEGRRYDLSAMCQQTDNSNNRCNLGYSVTAGGRTLLSGTYAVNGPMGVKKSLGTVVGTGEAATVTMSATDRGVYVDTISLLGR